MDNWKNKQTYPALFKSGFVYITESEIDQLFVDTLSTPRRKLLASLLRLFVHELKSLGVKGELWIDGSFSTKNPEPMDFDVFLVIPRVTLAGMTKENRDGLYKLTDIKNRPYVRAKWSCDLYVAESSDIASRKNFEELFSNNPDSLNKKGIPVIKL